MKTINEKKVKDFWEKIFSFYEREGRDLPWRKTTDMYEVFVSEVMLQQTQVSRVVEKFVSWLERFPTVESLSSASLYDVLDEWKGLGFNSRGKRLWESAKIVVEKYNGVFPLSVDELLSLPGVGPYTARSVLVFARNVDEALVDTNIRRILIFEFGLDEKMSDKDLQVFAQSILPSGRSRDWHNALMDYGSLVLTAKSSGISPKSKQSKFKGSRRECRAKMLRFALENKFLDEKKAKEICKENNYCTKEILDELVSEGLFVYEEGEKKYFVGEGK
jgi:A/G-specific adenine glycosylase